MTSARQCANGLSLSLGTDSPLDATQLAQAAGLVEQVQARWFTEHIAYCRVPGLNIGHLAPLPYTWEALDVLCRHVRELRQCLGVPILMENIASLVSLPGQMTEAEFIGELVARTDCGLLLDLHNLHANAVNHHFDPYVFMEALPLDAVREVHLAGGHDDGGVRIDSHSSPPPTEVWELLRWLAPRAPLEAAIIEWDVHIPELDTVLREARTAATILQERRPSCPLPPARGRVREGGRLHLPRHALLDLQTALAQLYTHPLARQQLFVDPSPPAEDDEVGRTLSTLDPSQVERYALSLKRKRAGEARSWIVATANALGARYRPLFFDYCDATPPPATIACDASQFLDYLLEQPPQESDIDHLDDLARYERVRVELQVSPELLPRQADSALVTEDSVPRLDSKARVASYSCDVIVLYRSWIENQPVAVPAAPTALLLARQYGGRVEARPVNPATAQLLSLCDGSISLGAACFTVAASLGLTENQRQSVVIEAEGLLTNLARSGVVVC